MSTFELLPAIDLRGGRVVRLRQGDFDRETRYASDPVAVAAAFADQGARWLHIVDLDGAREGEPRQLEIIGRIAARAGDRIACQVAGGLRDAAAVDLTLAAGARRIVVGTAALADPALVASLVERHGADRIVVALDVRDGRAVGEGWRDGAISRPVTEVVEDLGRAGVTTFVVTAIQRDGMLEGPDLRLLRSIASLGRYRVIASGGIATLDDLVAARNAGCTGAIVGRAIYEGRIEIGAAVKVAAGANPPPRTTAG